MTRDIRAAHATAFVYASRRGTAIHLAGRPSCRFGHQLPGRAGAPDGIFAEWSWDGQRLRIRTDRYGLFPLYYSYGPDGALGVSPSIPALLAHGAPTDLDYRSLSVFFRLGYFIGDDTPFRFIRAFPPDADCEWHAGRFAIRGGRPAVTPQALTRPQAVEACIQLFRESIRRRASDLPFAVPLSGGRDSRHILLELCALGRPPAFCITIPKYPPSHDDRQIASLVAARAGIRHIVLRHQDARLQSECRNIVSGSFCTDEGSWMVEMADYLRGTVGAVYDGLGGDILSNGVFLTPELLALYESHAFSALATRLMSSVRLLPGGELTLRSVLPREQYRKVSRELAHEHLTNELKTHADAANPVGSFLFWNRVRRELALSPCRVLTSAVPQVFIPYLDHALYDLLAGLPARMFMGEPFHDEVIRRAHPICADIPYQGEGNDQRFDPDRHQERFYHEVAAHILKQPVRSSRLIRREFVLPRLACALASPRYRSRSLWLSPILLLYLSLLGERIAEPAAGRRRR